VRSALRSTGRWALALALVWPAWCLALMAGLPPDSPTARVDGNTAASPWNSAVSVLVNGQPFSGVVVAPQYVLTAAHVVGLSPPTALQVQINAGAPVLVGVTAVQKFPSASFPYDDLALLTLAAEAPAAVTIRPIYTTALPGPRAIELVGYGSSGAGNVGPTVSPQAAVKRRGRNVVDALADTVDTSGRTSRFYLFDFDGASGNGALGGGSLGNSVETGLAGGDSGSPAFIEIDGQVWLFGLNNFTTLPAAGAQPDFRFGSVSGGIVLGDARFLPWLQAQTNGTLGPRPVLAEVPLPWWSLAMLGVALAGSAGAVGVVSWRPTRPRPPALR
jgi:Trypsin-like peptidase domain